jgi:hypothetical protein
MQIKPVRFAGTITGCVVIATCLLSIFTSGCSTSRLAAGAMVPVLENARDASLGSNDYKTFEAAAPSNIFLLEGLIRTDPKNPRLRLAASMLYFSYAFAFVEEQDEVYASLLYLKGLSHGQAALSRNKKVRTMWDQQVDKFSEMTKYLKKKDVPAMVWTAANWSQFISLHLDSTDVLVDIPRVTALLERAAELDGGFFEGLPHIILGSLHSFRPPLMGGSPDKSKENFDRAMQLSHGKFLLAQFFYAKFYCYRVQDSDEFEATLNGILAEPLSILPRYRLLNEIAKQKAARLLGEEDELF